MSFSEDFDRHREPLLRMAVAGVPVVSAAGALGISSGRAYEILRAAGRGSGRAKTKITAEHRSAVLAVFAESAGICQAATGAGLSHSAARLILVHAGVLAAAP